MVSAPGIRYMSTVLTLAKATQTGISQRSRAEAVAHIAHRLDVPPVDLGAEASDVHLEDVATGVEAEAPDVREQLVARAHLAGAAHQVAEQDELPLRQGRAAVTVVQDAALEVETHGPDLEPPSGHRRGCLGQPRVDPREQLGHGERLRQ